MAGKTGPKVANPRSMVAKSVITKFVVRAISRCIMLEVKVEIWWSRDSSEPLI